MKQFKTGWLMTCCRVGWSGAGLCALGLAVLLSASLSASGQQEQKPPRRIRVSSRVQEAKLVNKVQPIYPLIAKQARIQGVVRLEAIIAKDGNIQKLRVIEGHPLLVQSALDAVQQWRYEPTLLNNEPVEVVTFIDVPFQLERIDAPGEAETLIEKPELYEQRLQSTITHCIASEVQLYLRNLNAQTESLVLLLELTGAIDNVGDPKHEDSLRRATVGFVRGAENVVYLTVVNNELRGIAAGDPSVVQDDSVKKHFREAFQKVQLADAFHSGAFLVTHEGKDTPLMVMAHPLVVGSDFRGMVATVVNLEFLRQRLKENSLGGLVVYVVDDAGRLIVHPHDELYVVGQDMSDVGIVQTFLEHAALTEHTTLTGRFKLEAVEMLGTVSGIAEMRWAVIAQKPVNAIVY